VGRPVTVTGEFVAADEVYVRDFDRDAAGLAHATPLRTDQGAAILVVRGWSEGVGDHAPPAGPRTITGVLEPSQANGSPIDDDRVAEGLRISALVPAFGYDLYAGYVVLDQDDPARMGLAPLEPPLPDPSRWAGARNLVYAVQWWVFAGFVAFMWWRMVSETGSRRTARVL
jgi:cytochrome oxidase assembly protein ShyY1